MLVENLKIGQRVQIKDSVTTPVVRGVDYEYQYGTIVEKEDNYCIVKLKKSNYKIIVYDKECNIVKSNSRPRLKDRLRRKFN